MNLDSYTNLTEADIVQIEAVLGDTEIQKHLFSSVPKNSETSYTTEQKKKNRESFLSVYRKNSQSKGAPSTSPSV